MRKSVYGDLAKILWPFFTWLGIGWVAFPIFAPEIASAFGETFNLARVEPIVYTLAALCFGISAVSFWLWKTTSPVTEDYFVEKGKKLTFKCPYCFRKINIDEVQCPYCKKKIPR